MAHRFCAGTGGARIAVVFDVGLKSRPVVLHMYIRREGSSSGQSVLQGDGRASTEEHVVINSQFPGRICVWNVIVDCLDRGSTWDLTATGGQGVLWKWGHLVSET